LIEGRRELIEPSHCGLSIRRQCELLGLNRASYYYQPVSESSLNLNLMRWIDEQYLKTPFYPQGAFGSGSRKLTEQVQRAGYRVNRKRVQRLMGLMGLQAVSPKPKTSLTGPDHQIYPYLLRNVSIDRPNQVWGADITYVPLAHGFLYLVAILDWYSRYVLAWQLSNSLNVNFCLLALQQALAQAKPDIFNTDQGAQFTAQGFTERLAQAQVQISMDGRGRVFDNIFSERLWRTVKYEHIYLHAYETGLDLWTGLAAYFAFYNNERLHQSLTYRTPAEVYYGRC
jgi:putative transposase